MPHNRMHRVAHLSLLVGTMLAANAADAVAQQPTQAQTNAIRQSCRSDYQAHCASVPTGGSAALQCLQQNMPGLSPSCQSAVSAVGGGSSTPTASAPAAPRARPGQHAALATSTTHDNAPAGCADAQRLWWRFPRLLQWRPSRWRQSSPVSGRSP